MQVIEDVKGHWFIGFPDGTARASTFDTERTAKQAQYVPAAKLEVAQMEHEGGKMVPLNFDEVISLMVPQNVE